MQPNQTPANTTPSADADAKTRPTAIDLFSKSVEAIKVNLPLHLLFYFAPIAVAVVLFITLLGSYATSLSFNPANTGGVVEEGSEALLGASFFVSMISFAVVMVAVSVVSYLANTYVGLQGAQGKKTTFQAAIQGSTKYIGSLLLLGLLFSVLIMAGFFLLIIPGVIIGIYLWPRVMILPSVMIREDLSAFDAYRRADKIVKAGGIWEVAFVFLAIGFIGIIPFIGSLVSTVLSFLYSLAPTLRVLETSPLPKNAAPKPEAAPSPATPV